MPTMAAADWIIIYFVPPDMVLTALDIITMPKIVQKRVNAITIQSRLE